MENLIVKTPWKDHMGEVPMHLDYYKGTLFGAVEQIAERYPDYVAFDFMGKSTTYKKLVEQVRHCAACLDAIGIEPNDKITIAMPNCPQAIIMFYAVNLVGGIANMIHPLSAEKEITFYLQESESVAVLTLDQFYEKMEKALQGTKVEHIIAASIVDALSPLMKIGYILTKGDFSLPREADTSVWWTWKEFWLQNEYSAEHTAHKNADDPAVILYSGGTTGTTKGIILTNKNFNALGQQVIAANPMFRPGDKMLAAMPIFHGFGLGVSIHSMLMSGGRCILVPQFTPKSYAKDLIKHKVNFIAGVPTLYEALLRLETMDGVDLSHLKGVFSGGDSLSVELKKKLDAFLEAHNCKIQVREGYGTTETVTACCLTPPHMHKEGSIGIPFPDTYIKVVRPGNEEELPYGEE